MRSISDIELTLMTMRASPTARRSSSETFEQVNQICSGVNPARRAMKISPGDTQSHPNPASRTSRRMASAPLAFIA